MSSTRTIAFFGATGGCGRAALKRAVNDGHLCVVLLRNPSKLDDTFPTKPSNLIIHQGNAHDVESVAQCIAHPTSSNRFVDSIMSSIGAQPDLKTLSIDDLHVCEKGINTLVEAMRKLREEKHISGQPLITVVSSTGISRYQRDVPLAFWPIYKIALAKPHADKEALERITENSGERFVIIRATLLWDTKDAKETRPVRVGVEDPKTGAVEKKAVGYTITRDAVGGWMYDNLLSRETVSAEYEGKAVGLTF